MFTGIIEEIGIVENVRSQKGAIRLTIAAEEVLQDLAIDDSISVNGVCLTAISFSKSTFTIDAVEETIRKTTLGKVKSGTRVNLERALNCSARLGGHIVQGHIDCVGRVTSIRAQQGGQLLSIKIPVEKLKYVIMEGSIAVNGVSLTVAHCKADEFTVSLIPHTLNSTTLGALKVGVKVNIEVDLIGKYVESILNRSEDSKFTEGWLKQFGFQNQ
jgi:riboflavin synthase